MAQHQAFDDKRSTTRGPQRLRHTTNIYAADAGAGADVRIVADDDVGMGPNDANYMSAIA